MAKLPCVQQWFLPDPSLVSDCLVGMSSPLREWGPAIGPHQGVLSTKSGNRLLRCSSGITEGTCEAGLEEISLEGTFRRGFDQEALLIVWVTGAHQDDFAY